jgi:hypothetical protein
MLDKIQEKVEKFISNHPDGVVFIVGPTAS